MNFEASPRFILKISLYKPNMKAHRDAPGVQEELQRITDEHSNDRHEKKNNCNQDDDIMLTLRLREMAKILKLGASPTAKILDYKFGSIDESYRNKKKSTIEIINGSYFEDGIDGESADLKRNKTKVQVPTKIAHKVLGAIGLRPEFYSNLISWSNLSSKIAVAIGSSVYSWNKDVELIATMNKNEKICSISYSPQDHLLVATKQGNLTIIFQNPSSVQSKVNKMETVRLPKGSYALCCTWLPKISTDGSSSKFFIGDSIGKIHLFEIKNSIGINGTQNNEIRHVYCMANHQQKICGIAIDEEERYIAVGGNDNRCTIWDISNEKKPKLLHSLMHRAAVKAIAFSPWSKSILATGGGYSDKCIRFWHTKSGTLLNEWYTGSQITSLYWSKYKRELIATYGASKESIDNCKKSIITCFTYPKMEATFTVLDSINIKINCAALSPNQECLCVASNDDTVRFYRVWDVLKYELRQISDFNQGHLYGSPLIAIEEEGLKSSGCIR